jgi:glutathione S-transferase
MAYVKRLLAAPSMKRWYEAALVEPYRDHDHEVELAAAGKITQDLRKPLAAASV